MVLDVILYAFVGLFFAASRTKKNKGFCRESTASLRGLAMLGIILHHIHQRISISSHFSILPFVGYLATGLFFFISGYGNMLSLEKRKVINYRWFYNKLLKIYIPFFFVYWLYYVTNAILYTSKTPSLKEVIVDLLTISLPNTLNWFPKIILLCFLVHGIITKVFRPEAKRVLALCTILALYVFVMWKANMPRFWYNSVMCYPVGCLFAYQEKGIIEHLKKQYNQTVLFLVTGISFCMLFIGTKWCFYIELLCSLSFSIMCYFYTTLFTVKTKMLSWVGNNSFEFYVFHIWFLQAFSVIITRNAWLYSFCVIIGSFVGVFVYLLAKSKTQLILESVRA